MTAENPYRLDIDRIQKYLPHRAPFLLVDRVLEIHPTGSLSDLSPSEKVGTKVVALKNVTYNEPYFQGHFPGFAILPGVLLIEIMAQTASFSLYPYMLHASGGEYRAHGSKLPMHPGGCGFGTLSQACRARGYFAGGNDGDQVPRKALGFSMRDLG